MKMVVPAIVVHPCTLFRDGLCQILTGTRFKPVHVAAEVDEAAIEHLSSAQTSLWLLGLERCNERALQLIGQLCPATSGVKAVILAEFQTTDDVSRAIKAGASGFLCQDISRERLVTSLELIALGEIVVPATYLHAIAARTAQSEQPQSRAEHVVASEEMANGAEHSIDEGLIKGFSKRETSVLRLLIQGASNKIIARQLVITEATVKVYIKAILRKLRLHNRTQAAMWASNHLSADGANHRGSGDLFVSAIDHLHTTAPDAEERRRGTDGVKLSAPALTRYGS
jgi:two-component system, NarL family, nitrate/nitrite response regulator NarL